MTPELSTLEPLVRRFGDQLARLSAGLAPTIFESRWWSQGVINLAMKDLTFKAQLFRFIDVLASIEDNERVVRLAEEYFGDLSRQLFGLQWGLKAATVTSLGARLTGKSIRHLVEQMARSFIAGSSIDDAMPVLARLWKEGRAWSVDLLGEATVSDREADLYRDHCLDALNQLAQAVPSWPAMPLLERDHLGALPRVQLSIKVSALSPRLDPIDPDGSYESVAERLRPLLDMACRLPASVIFDMEQAETKDLILAIFRRVLSEEPYRHFPYAGLALQAYHRRTGEDIEQLLQWIKERDVPITIRLVKGAYWDSDTIRYEQRGWPRPLFEQKPETDANYERLTRLLLEHAGLIRAAFGTHNLRSLAHVEAVAESLRLSPEQWEYQMIFGMAEPFQAALTKFGRRLRLYTPVGELLPGMAYLVRRLLENTSNESFLRKEYVESQPLSALLAPPVSSPPRRNGRLTGSTTPKDETAPVFQNEPLTDFSETRRRTEFAETLAKTKRAVGRTFSPLAGRGLVPTGGELASRNPSRPEEIVGRLASYRASDIVPARLLGTLANSWSDWKAAPAKDRAAVLRRAARLMRERRFELASWEILETGKPWREADADVAEAVDFLEFYAAEAERLDEPLRLGHYPGELNHRWYGPRGITAVIAPWNFPLAIPTGMVSAALVTGNPVCFKPSERSPVMGWFLTHFLLEAGLPEGVLHFLPGGPDVGRALVEMAEVATIAFTGSRDAGLWILERASHVQPGQAMVKRVIAEMGGKNAIIVDDTADLDEAVTGVVQSFTGYSGQKCSACSRVIVDEAVYGVFVRRLAEAVMSLRLGSGEDPATQVGPVIDARARARIREYIALGKQEGRVFVERQEEGPGSMVGPAVFVDIAPHHRIAREEIFGPVLSVLRAKTFDEALGIANASAYALTGGLYSRSPANIANAQRAFDVGNLYINRSITGALVGRQPFGGHRMSGVGAKAGGSDYLTQFMVSRVVSENTLRRGFAPTE
jgi:RHH-type proline utilization regulon transcriptional repressor/proline dehydrogenase/delta 1-pyrroline-5-carboxylate dehydrogenase